MKIYFFWPFKNQNKPESGSTESYEFYTALEKMSHLNCHYYWHEDDKYTLTSKGYIWTYPGNKLINKEKSICVMPENNQKDIYNCAGICSDNIFFYRETYR